MPERLEGKFAIVVDGTVGIGEAVVLKFVREGAKVCVFGLSDDPVDDVSDAINEHYGEVAIGVTGDAAEIADTQ